MRLQLTDMQNLLTLRRDPDTSGLMAIGMDMARAVFGAQGIGERLTGLSSISGIAVN